MLDLAISIDTDSNNITIVETNHGLQLKAPGWPQDCDFQLVAFDPLGKICEVIPAECLAEDVGMAVMALEKAKLLKGRKPDWYRRLKRLSKVRS